MLKRNISISLIISVIEFCTFSALVPFRNMSTYISLKKASHAFLVGTGRNIFYHKDVKNFTRASETSCTQISQVLTSMGPYQGLDIDILIFV